MDAKENVVKIKLIPNWRTAYRYVSVQLTALLALLLSLEPLLPQITTYLPPHYALYLSLAILVARIIQQGRGAVKESKNAEALSEAA